MRMSNSSSRRQFLGLAGGAAVMGAVPLVTVRPADATPAMLAGAIRNVVGTAVVQTGRVKIDVPPLVENGNTVPMTVSVTSPMTADDYVKSIHVFNEKNPQPNIGNFYLGQRAGRAQQEEPQQHAKAATQGGVGGSFTQRNGMPGDRLDICNLAKSPGDWRRK